MHYLDNSATTMVSEKAAQKAMEIMTNQFGNPSSLHDFGFMAQKELEKARTSIAEVLAVDKKQIFFTSGGTESNNTAIFGTINSLKKFGNKIVTSAIEHPAVLECMKILENDGFEVVYLKPNESGNILKEDIEKAIDKNTILVSLMSVNNETGAILPLESVALAIKKSGSKAYFHVDHVQGFCKIKLNIKSLGINLLTASGHKVHAPKGVGILYKNVNIKPLIVGGGQEGDFRSGTENLASITALGVAVKENFEHKKVKELSDYLKNELSKIPEITFNSPKENCDYIVNFSLGKVRGETMLHFLASHGVYVSTGSACSGSKGSHVLNALGYNQQRILSSLRVSLCRYNTKEDIDALIEALKLGLQKLAR
ncbi:MAG: cysteine desulfurase family protein [Clostridia bacterium]